MPCSVASLATPAAAQPADVIHLFNGKDLSSFYTWLVNDHHADPDKVFSVVDNVDGAPAIRISGQKFGGITTHEEYETYRLVVEFRWGTVTWNPRTSRARDSGVLIHCQGADGNTGKTFNGPWMRSIEAQIIEGGVGDFLMVQGYEAGRHAPVDRDDRHPRRSIGTASSSTTRRARRASSATASGSTGRVVTRTGPIASAIAAPTRSRNPLANGTGSRSSSRATASPTSSTASS